MNFARHSVHSLPCSKNSFQVLIVAGGYDDAYLDSTEIMNYKTVEGGYREASSMQWREVTPMPSPKNGLRGASVDGVFHVVGFSQNQRYRNPQSS